MKRILYIAVMAILTVSCAKASDGPVNSDESEFPEANLIITGVVCDHLSTAALPGISITLRSYQDAKSETPLSTELTTSGENGLYLLRKRFNAPVSSMIYTVEFTDESGQYLPLTKEITIANWSHLFTPRGYEITRFDAFLDKAQ